MRFTATVTDAAGNTATSFVDVEVTGSEPATFTGDVSLPGFTVPAGEVWDFDPAADTTVTVSGNVVVQGTLRMRPQPGVQHTLRFADVDEAAMVGGGMAVLDTDVGLWVVDDGILDAVGGDPRVGWNRTGDDPTWRPTDEILTAPQAAGDFTTFAAHTPGNPLPTTGGIATEAFNLTRSVVIGGQPGHRTHIQFLHITRPQTVKHVRVEHVGPRQLVPDRTDGITRLVPGRYGLHFHHCQDGSRGSLVEGVAVVDCGTRAFVPHASHGVTLRDCVAYRCAEEAYWWDPDAHHTSYGEQASHDTLLEHCAGFAVGGEPKSWPNHVLSIFHLGQGEGNAAVDCAAAGLIGNRSLSSAYHWPETTGAMPGHWRFEDCVAHNNWTYGLYVWQSDPWFVRDDVIGGHFVAYRNGRAGVSQGAYMSIFEYGPAAVFDNGARDPKEGQWKSIVGWGGATTDVTIDAAGRTPHAFLIAEHRTFQGEQRGPYIMRNVAMDGATVTAVEVREDPNNIAGWYDFIGCTVNGADPEPSDFTVTYMAPTSRIRAQRSDGTAWQLTGDGAVTDIPALEA